MNVTQHTIPAHHSPHNGRSPRSRPLGRREHASALSTSQRRRSPKQLADSDAQRCSDLPHGSLSQARAGFELRNGCLAKSSGYLSRGSQVPSVRNWCRCEMQRAQQIDKRRNGTN